MSKRLPASERSRGRQELEAGRQQASSERLEEIFDLERAAREGAESKQDRRKPIRFRAFKSINCSICGRTLAIMPLIDGNKPVIDVDKLPQTIQQVGEIEQTVICISCAKASSLIGSTKEGIAQQKTYRDRRGRIRDDLVPWSHARLRQREQYIDEVTKQKVVVPVEEIGKTTGRPRKRKTKKDSGRLEPTTGEGVYLPQYGKRLEIEKTKKKRPGFVDPVNEFEGEAK